MTGRLVRLCAWQARVTCLDASGEGLVDLLSGVHIELGIEQRHLRILTDRLHSRKIRHARTRSSKQSSDQIAYIPNPQHAHALSQTARNVCIERACAAYSANKA